MDHFRCVFIVGNKFLTMRKFLNQKTLWRQTTRILGQVERGDLALQIHIPELQQTTKHLEGIANRMIIGVLLSAMVLGLSLFIPILDLNWPWSIFTWIIIGLFFAAIILSMWLIWSILRSRR